MHTYPSLMNGPSLERVAPAPVLGAGSEAWFCVQSHPKHEHIAASYLAREMSLEVFLPRVRFKRATVHGPAWAVEALFLNYVFARFDLASCLRHVRHARGVRQVVHFGAQWPTVPDTAIAELRAAVGPGGTHVIPDTFDPGDSVRVAGGPLDGLKAVVTRVMPGPQRVALLLDFLGRQTTVDLPASQVILDSDGLHGRSVIAWHERNPATEGCPSA